MSVLNPERNRLGRVLSAKSGAPGAFAMLRHWRLIVILFTFGVSLLFIITALLTGNGFWDFRVYQVGVAAVLENGTPYDPTRFFPFTYPPLVALFLAKLAWFFTAPAGLALLLAVHTICFIAVPFLVMPASARKQPIEFLWLFGVFLVAFSFAGAKTFASGNFAAAMTLAILSSLLYGVRSRNYWPFWAVLVLLSQVKIYLFCFALVPFLLERMFWTPVLMGLATLALYSLNFFIEPGLWQDYLATVKVISHLPGHIGVTPMAGAVIALNEIHSLGDRSFTAIVLAVHAVFAASVIAFSVSVMWGRARPADGYEIIGWVIMAALLISPRLVEYDVAIMTIPFVFLLRRLVNEQGPALWVVLGGVFFATGLVRTPLSDMAGFVVLAAVWLATGVSWLMSAPIAQAVPQKNAA